MLAESYPRGTTDFGGILGKVKTANPDVLAAATYDAVAMTRQLKALGIMAAVAISATLRALALRPPTEPWIRGVPYRPWAACGLRCAP